MKESKKIIKYSIPASQLKKRWKKDAIPASQPKKRWKKDAIPASQLKKKMNKHKGDIDINYNWSPWNDFQRPQKETGEIGDQRLSRPQIFWNQLEYLEESWRPVEELKFDYTNKWYMHNPESIPENEIHKIPGILDTKSK